ncbi:MAG TPA: type II secretion system F family protein [Bryobacteraceae bacterium]|jgi:tight adherence protein C
MALVICISLFLALMIAISLYGYRRYLRPARVYERLGRPVTQPSAVVNITDEPEQKMTVKVIEQLGNLMPISPADAAGIKERLVMGGYRSESAVAVFFGIRMLVCLAAIIFTFMVREKITDNPVLRVVLVVFGAAAGFMLPSLRLDSQVTKRQKRLRLALPDLLDLLVVAVEAGLGLDQAIQHCSRELEFAHKELSEEMAQVNFEMRAGKRRADALKNLSDRTGEAELRKLVAILVQTDRFGTSMAESLRNHSDDLRIRRRQEAEERAAKIGVKLVFPIFLFILPSMLVVSAGPGLLQVFKNLFPMMNGFGQ